MNATANQILDSALGLPESDRAALAACLIDSLSDSSEVEIRELWRTELESRLADLDNPALVKSTWRELRQRLEDRLHESR